MESDTSDGAVIVSTTSMSSQEARDYRFVREQQTGAREEAIEEDVLAALSQPPSPPYFVLAEIAPTSFSRLMYRVDCCGTKGSMECTDEDTYVARALSREPATLYAPERVTWMFKADGVSVSTVDGRAPRVELDVERTGSPPVDTVLVGPLAAQPTRVTITLTNIHGVVPDARCRVEPLTAEVPYGGQW